MWPSSIVLDHAQNLVLWILNNGHHFCNRHWEFHKSVIQIIFYFNYLFCVLSSTQSNSSQKIGMVTRDHKSYSAFGECRIQPANCSHTVMKSLHWQQLSYCLDSFIPLLCFTTLLQRVKAPFTGKEKSTEIQCNKGKPGYILITAQFLVLSSSSFIPLVFLKTGSVSTKNDILRQLRHSQSKLMKQ